MKQLSYTAMPLPICETYGFSASVVTKSSIGSIEGALFAISTSELHTGCLSLSVAIIDEEGDIHNVVKEGQSFI
jgi:hypothetical protein